MTFNFIKRYFNMFSANQSSTQAEKRQKTLLEIRSAIKEIDNIRLPKDELPQYIFGEAQKIIELSSQTLRRSERALIATTQNSIIKETKDVCQDIGKQASEIRKRIKKINDSTKCIKFLDEYLKYAVKIIRTAIKLCKNLS